MAFMSVLLMNIPALFIVIIILFVNIVGIISGLLFLIFLILYLRDKSKKWRKIVCIVSGIISLIILTLYVICGLVLNEMSKVTVDVGNGEQIKFSHKMVEEFYENIENGNIDELNNKLDKYPLLVNTYKDDRDSPLEIAIINKQYDSVKVLIERNVDINRMDRDDEVGPIELELLNFTSDEQAYRNYDEKIMEYLLSMEKIDVNKHNGDEPNIQAFIGLILSDDSISPKEEELLVKMLDKNADIYELNKKSQDTIQFLNSLDYSENVNKIEQIIYKYNK